MLRASLITLGDPERLTGGYLYHRRMAAAASEHDAVLRFESCPELIFPFGLVAARGVVRRARRDADVVVIDSIAAGLVGPWLAGVDVPLVAMLHQVPGGIDHGPVRSRIQSLLDRRAYRHVRRLMVASQTLADDLHARGFPSEQIRVVAPGRDPALPTQPPPELRRGRRAAFLCVGNWMSTSDVPNILLMRSAV